MISRQWFVGSMLSSATSAPDLRTAADQIIAAEPR
jgi:hypothetical protein